MKSPSFLLLESDRLQVRISLPGSRYRTTRFDWSAGVYHIVLDGRHQFASAEVTDGDLLPFRGQGLACEFGIRQPVGYSDCPVGGYFPKLGVGWVRRESDEDYNFFHHYLEMVPADFRWRLASPNQAVFHADGGNHRGWAWNLKRTWTLESNRLTLETTLENPGDFPIKTNEYCHNFLRPGTAPIGPGTVLELSHPTVKPGALFDPEACLNLSPGAPAGAHGAYPAAAFHLVPQGEFYAGNLCGPQVLNQAWWKLTSLQSGLTVREDLPGPCSLVDLWGKATVISPELFKELDVAPGQDQSWKRTWTFESL